MVAGSRTEDIDWASELLQTVERIFARAGYDLEPRRRSERDDMAGIFVASRPELGGVKRYAIEVADQIIYKQASAYREELEAHRKRGTLPFDELWVVAAEVKFDRGMLKRLNQGPFRVLHLADLRQNLARLRAGSKRRQPRTKIGKAILSNQTQIAVTLAALELLIEEKIQTLQSQRPNSDEAIAERDTSIDQYAKLKTQLGTIKTAIAQFKTREINEPAVVKSITSFTDGIRNWWNKDHEKICAKTYDMGLFAGAVGIGIASGASGNMALAVSAAMVSGKPVIDAIKGLAKKYTS